MNVTKFACQAYLVILSKILHMTAHTEDDHLLTGGLICTVDDE